MWGAASSMLGLGKVKNKMQNFDAAKEALLDAKKLFESINDKLGQANVNKELGFLYKETNDKARAKSHYFDAKTFYDEMQESSQSQRCVEEIIDLE